MNTMDAKHTLAQTPGIDLGPLPATCRGRDRLATMFQPPLTAPITDMRKAHVRSSRGFTAEDPKGDTRHLSDPVSLPPQQIRKQRKSFLIFIRILIKCLIRENNPILAHQVRILVTDCVRQYRLGNPHYMPLVEAIEHRLYWLVGEARWNEAIKYLYHYHRWKKQQSRQQQRSSPRSRLPPMTASTAGERRSPLLGPTEPRGELDWQAIAPMKLG